MITSADVWTIVKGRLQLTDDKLQSLFESYIAEIEYRIKHYCNIRTVPDDLLYVWASMVVDAVRVDLPNVDEVYDTIGGQVGNVKVGDTSVTTDSDSGSGLSNTSKSVIDQVVFDYRSDLRRYRRMRWG